MATALLALLLASQTVVVPPTPTSNLSDAIQDREWTATDDDGDGGCGRTTTEEVDDYDQRTTAAAVDDDGFEEKTPTAKTDKWTPTGSGEWAVTTTTTEDLNGTNEWTATTTTEDRNGSDEWTITTTRDSESTTDRKGTDGLTNDARENYDWTTTAGEESGGRTTPLLQEEWTPADSEETPNRSALLRRFRRLYPLHLWSQHGFFTEDFLELVDTLWLQHPPQSPLAHYSLAGAYSAIMVAGVSGNALVIYMFIRCRSLRTPANVLVMNLAVSDLFLLLNLVLFIYNSVYMGPALGVAGCQVYGFVGGLTGTVSIATLTLIALDRYRVIVHPLRSQPSRWRSRSWVLASWLYGALFSTPPLLGAAWAGRYVPEGFLTSCSFDYLHRGRRVYVLVFCVAAWLLPLLLIAFCYGAICRSAIFVAGKDAATVQRRTRNNNSTELRLALVVAAVVALWFLSWTPYAVVALLGALGQHASLSPLASMLPALFCKTASCVDPFLYAVTHPRFRRELADLLWRRRRRDLQRRQPPATTSIRASVTSEVDVEEEDVVVMVDMRRREACDTASPPPLPFPAPAYSTRPPSWFVPPRPRRNRATSVRRSSTPH